MKHKKSRLVMAVSIAVATSSLYAADSQLSFSNTFSLSDAQTPDSGLAFKAKLVRLGNGTLVSVFGDGADSAKMVYEATHPGEQFPLAAPKWIGSPEAEIVL